MIKLLIEITGEDLALNKMTPLLELMNKMQDTTNIKTVSTNTEKHKITDIQEEVEENTPKKPKKVTSVPKIEDEEIAKAEIVIKAEAKAKFIKLAKKDRDKAKALLDNYGVKKFSEIEDLAEDKPLVWEDILDALIKELK